MAEVKVGVKTSEFWVTLVPQLATILVVVGILPAEDVDAVVKMVAGIITGIVSLISLVAYVRSRTALKEQAMRIEDMKV